MPHLARTLLLGGAIVAASLATAAPASAFGCYEFAESGPRPVTVCVFHYSDGYCDADLCVNRP